MIDLVTALRLIREQASSGEAAHVLDIALAELERLYTVEEAAKRLAEALRLGPPSIPTGDHPDLVAILGPVKR